MNDLFAVCSMVFGFSCKILWVDTQELDSLQFKHVEQDEYNRDN